MMDMKPRGPTWLITDRLDLKSIRDSKILRYRPRELGNTAADSNADMRRLSTAAQEGHRPVCDLPIPTEPVADEFSATGFFLFTERMRRRGISSQALCRMIFAILG